jgi:phage gp36-like protein
MSYCSVANIEAAIYNDDLVQLTNDSGGDTVDETKITDAMSYVDSLIDGYLRGRYTLPLLSIPDEIKYIAIDYVVYRLYSRRLVTEIPASVEQKYKEVIKLLTDIQNGKFSLGVEDTNGYDNPILDTNKSTTVSSVNKYYNEDKWDEYDAWL